MGHVAKYPNGTFCWVELGTTDPEGARRFYGGLFGWDTETVPLEGGRTYTMCRIEGRDVAAMYEQPEEERAVAPPHWNSYISVDDIQTTTATAKGLGPVTISEPMDVLDSGRMTVLQDPGAPWSPCGKRGSTWGPGW